MIQEHARFLYEMVTSPLSQHPPPSPPIHYITVPLLGLTTLLAVELLDTHPTCETISEVASQSWTFTFGMGATGLCSIFAWLTLANLLISVRPTILCAMGGLVGVISGVNLFLLSMVPLHPYVSLHTSFALWFFATNCVAGLLLTTVAIWLRVSGYVYVCAVFSVTLSSSAVLLLFYLARYTDYLPEGLGKRWLDTTGCTYSYSELLASCSSLLYSTSYYPMYRALKGVK